MGSKEFTKEISPEGYDRLRIKIIRAGLGKLDRDISDKAALK
jgi:hypothetical protein